MIKDMVLELFTIVILKHLRLKVVQLVKLLENGAIGVTSAQKASDIEIGRYAISTTDGSVIDSTDYFKGDNHLNGCWNH